MLETPAASEMPSDLVAAHPTVFSPIQTPLDFSSAGALLTPGIQLQDTISPPVQNMTSMQIPTENGGKNMYTSKYNSPADTE